jgi:cell division protein FtsI (penicillin-binding protein 3)
MNDIQTGARKAMRVRILLLTCAVLVLPALVMQRAFQLQVLRAPQLKEQAENQYLRELPIAPKRGTIYDRDGAELAVSVDVDSIWANPKQLRKSGGDPRTVAKQLAELLSIDDVDGLTQRLAADRYFVWVKRRVSAAQGKAVQALKLAGISSSEEARRFYPNRELAAHLLGFANVDGRGIEGLELTLEDKLRGTVSSSPAVLDRRGAVVYSEQLLDDREAQGNDVTLTIDKTLQYFAQHELELAVRTAEAHAGSVVVIDPVKGEILALANYPTFNPNEPHRFSSSERRNRAVADSFEPGSTLKPFTVASALAAGAVSPSDTIDCSPNSLQVEGGVIHDVHQFQRLTPAEILTFSSNIGASKIGSALGRQRLHRGLSAFGFGQLTGSGLPGEALGSLRPYQHWYPMDAATIPFGQGMSVTTLQLASAMGALANRGRLMEPLLVKRVVDAHGQTVSQAVPRIRQQVVPESTARLITDMLVGVTGPGGTGTEAAIPGYLVAGKTGTAQKSGGKHGYTKDKWVSSFVGYAPAQKPRLVIAVVLDEPMIAHQGGQVAAPAFRRIMEASLRHLGVPAQGSGDANVDTLARAPRSSTVAPATHAVGPLPAPPVPQLLAALGPNEAQVPNLLGRTARDAIVQARRAQFVVTLHGSGVVSAQDPEAGAVVPRGATLGLKLSSPPTQAPAGALDVDLAAIAPSRTPQRTASDEPSLVSVAARGGQDG